MKKTAFYNGIIYTADGFLAQAFTVEEGRFGAVGSNEEALALLGPEDERVDLQGRFLCPGFNDSHMHLLNYGQTLYGARLMEHTESLSGMLAYLKEYLDIHPLTPGQWLKGRGWNQDYFTDLKRMPDRQDLDSISTEIPILITRACGHACVVNSRVLALAGIDKNTPDPAGGLIGRDEQGLPDGRLYENAIDLVDMVKPQPDRTEIKEMLRLAMEAVNRYGITSVQSDDFSTFRGVPWQEILSAYRELEEAGQMTVRVNEQANFTETEDFQALIQEGWHTGKGSEFFRMGPLKLLGDGSLGSRTAHLSLPYLGGDGQSRGFSLFTPEHMEAMVEMAQKNDFSVAVHAIGDACLDEVLDAIEKAEKVCPRTDTRHGIVHCQISRPDQLERMARLGLHIYVQSIFLDYDNHIVEKLVPPELAASSYSWKTLLRKGLAISNGSDCPVELPDVMSGIECAVTRQSLDGTGPYLPREAFTIGEALDSFTAAGARASFEEENKGRIRPGMLADFVILSDNPLKTEPCRLHEIRPLALYLAGRPLYQE